MVCIRFRQFLSLAILPCAFFASTAAVATHSASGPVAILATVAASCTVGASSLAFGSATSTAIQSGNVDGTGVVTLTCTNGTAYTVALDKGTAAGATLATRKMSAGALRLNYSVFTSMARTTVWGDGTLGSSTVAGTGSGSIQSVVAYGRIYAGQIVPAGSFTDTIVVTVTY